MYLLDTHALLWFLDDDAKLPVATKELIGTSPDVYVSIASFWKVAIKSSIGKLKLNDSITRIMELCSEKKITVLPIKAAHLERLRTLPFIHKDPFDRLLICQAQAEDMTLITVDENIPKYDVRTKWDS